MNTTNNAVTITGSGKIVAVINGKGYSVNPDHINYNKIVEAIKSQDWTSFVSLSDIASQVKQYTTTDGVEIVDGAVMYRGEAIHNTLTNRIVKFMGEGLPFKPLVKFLENLMNNPSKRAVDELYTFLEVGELPITEDGCFLAYKNVRANYMDIHSGTFSNKVGDVCEMPRNRVCDNSELTCSAGLHFCSIAYLPHFADDAGGHTMIVKINPADVVSIPKDYNNTKGRTCKYEVIAEYTEDWRSKINNGESGWNADLYTSDGDEYDDEGDDYDPEDCTYSNGCDENHCFCEDAPEESETPCEDYGVKPNGQKFHNVRGADGKFVKKEGLDKVVSGLVKAFSDALNKAGYIH
jgi:hypothetical protein